MGTLPYFEASMARLNLQEAEPIVDKYAPAKEALSIAQKFVNQQDEAKTANVLAKARSEWNVKMNKLQQDTGLDAEGFSDKVGEMLQEEEQRYLSEVPMLQRQKFKEQFSALKYDFLSKAGIYENQALAEKMVVNVKDTINLNANSIVSDYTQRSQITKDTDELIDGLGLADSVASALKKESREAYAISEINALTNFSPETLLKNLNGGLYDADIDPTKKAAAINQAKAKIKSNEVEVKTLRAQYANDMYSNDLARVYDTDNPISDVDLMERKKDYLKIGAVDKWEKLYKAHDNLKKRNMNLLEARNSYLDGTLVAGNEKSIKTINALAEQDIKNNPDAALSIGRNFVERTGYLPDLISTSLLRDMKGIDKQKKAEAGLYYLSLTNSKPDVKDFLGETDRKELIAIGLMAASGMHVNDIDEKMRVKPSADMLKSNRTLWNKREADIVDECPFNDSDVKAEYRKYAYSMFERFGDEDLAKESAGNYVKRIYNEERVGTGYKDNFLLGNFIGGGNVDLARHYPEKVMLHGPFKEYGRFYSEKFENKSDIILAMNEDLLLFAKQYYPDATKENITISNRAVLTSDGYQYIVEMNGQPLQNLAENVSFPYLLWKPDAARTKRISQEIADSVDVF
jgi:hypothetical protein